MAKEEKKDKETSYSKKADSQEYYFSWFLDMWDTSDNKLALLNKQNSITKGLI